MKYSPGTADPLLTKIRNEEHTAKERREANRPTGTEIGQVSQKLQALTKQLKEQQEALALQQKALEAQQAELARVTPKPDGVIRSAGSATATKNPATVHTWSTALPAGKSKALVTVSARATNMSSTDIPLVMIYEDSTLVAVAPLYGAAIYPTNSASYSAVITGNHTYSIRLGMAGAAASAAVSNIVAAFGVTYFA
jgi:NADH dehydrogenase/NADH:ubiquinone oxidoreductase subunit G